jgi:tyrosyl-tRNA synthetase
LEKSKSEARRLIKGKAVKINNKIILNDKQKISIDFFQDNFLKLSLGKKRHIKIEID